MTNLETILSGQASKDRYRDIVASRERAELREAAKDDVDEHDKPEQRHANQQVRRTLYPHLYPPLLVFAKHQNVSPHDQSGLPVGPLKREGSSEPRE